MSNDVLGYSSHDWRKHTDSAVVVDDNVEHSVGVNDSRVIFINPKTLKEETIGCFQTYKSLFVNNFNLIVV